MSIKFKTLEIEGFGSIHNNVVFKLDRPGFNILQAKNGSGKTSIVSALCWVLFGETLKSKASVATWEKRRLSSFRGTMVKIHFEKEGQLYTITRCKDFKGKIITGVPGRNTLHLDVHGQLMYDRDKKDVKEKIKDILGYSFDLFTNSVVFGQKVQRIIGQSGPKQKEILEQAFEVGYINKAHALEKKNGNELMLEYNTLESYVERLKFERKVLREKIDGIKEREAKFIHNRFVQVGDINKEIGEYTQEQEDLKIAKGKFKHNQSKIQSLETDISKLEKKIEKRNQAVNEEFLAKNASDTLEQKIEHHKVAITAKRNIYISKVSTCEKCGNKLNKESTIKYRENVMDEIKKLKAELAGYENQLPPLIANWTAALAKTKTGFDYDKRLKDLNKQLKDIFERSNYRSIKDIEREEHKVGEKVRELINKRQKVFNTEFDEDATKISANLKAVKGNYKLKLNELKELEKRVAISKWLVNDALSNKGLKAYIFDSMLESINQRLIHYSMYIAFKANISIDMESANKNVKIKVFDDTEEVSANDLSGGQAQLIDIAIAFAIDDVVSLDKGCNIRFMDEVFESLDTENVELVTELIQEKAKGKSLFLVTHLTNFNVTNAHIIKLRLNEHKLTEIKQ